MTDAEQDRAEKLQAAGLTLLGTVGEVNGVTPKMAWDRVVRGDDPAVVVDEDADLSEVDTAWLGLTQERGFFGEDGEFHVSTTGATGLPWARVRLSNEPRLASTLVVYPGEPEFVALSADGSKACGVTTEEHGFWIMWREFSPAS
jgi:hypothetical protein